MQSQKTSWGSNLNDFRITAKAKAVHTQQPKVADMLDEFSNAIEAMAEGLDNNSPDEDTAFVDAPPQEAIDVEEVPNGVPRKMEAGDLRTLTKAIMVASKCTLESNTIPNDLPDHIVQSIKRHDSWYMAIVDQVFDTVLKYTTRPNLCWASSCHGVPRSEILVGGACQIARLLNAHRRRLRDPSYSSTLPPWKYDDSKKASEKPAKLQPRFVDEQSPGHHRSVFDKYSESYAGDDTFWEIIFVELGKKWNIETQAQLQHRFGWVLKYLRSGELPEEAKTASQILQECLSNSVLSSEKHPYRRRGRSRQ
ncbi:hypothetical protein FOVSG1_003833 [Fusarium oxysporum f. sp. vasinfectum]